MEVPELIDVLRVQGQLLADAAEHAGRTAPVPTCPGWTVRDLLLHVGGVHRWATTIVGQARPGNIELVQPYDIAGELPEDDDLVDWYRTGHATLVRTLSRAPANLRCFSFLPAPSALAFWARRQAHETTVHRVDADAATGPGTSAPIDPEFAADGIDELVTCFVSRRGSRLRTQRPRTLRLHAIDADQAWLVWMSKDKPRAEKVDPRDATAMAKADVTATGPAATMYLVVWNRLPWTGLQVSGDHPGNEIANLWKECVHVRWS